MILRTSTIVIAGIVFALTMLLANTSLAQQIEPPRANDAGPRGDGPVLFGFGPRNFALREALDKDKDGKISAEEIKVAAEALKTLDKNKDGKLTADEIGWPPQFGGFGGRGRGGFAGPGGGRGGFGGRGPGGQIDFAKRMMSRDANGDGKISADELPRSMRRVLELADENRDDVIDEAEAKKFADTFGSVSRPPVASQTPADQGPQPAKENKPD